MGRDYGHRAAEHALIPNRPSPANEVTTCFPSFGPTVPIREGVIHPLDSIVGLRLGP